MNPSGSITEHFSWGEALCKCGCEMPQAIQAEVVKTAEWAEEVRTALGGHPLRVLSWYRCKPYNKAVKGKANSQHLIGRAIDFAHKALTPQATQALVATIFPALIRGFGKYPGFTHIDCRTGKSATW